jgi:hypothetical protein
MKRQWIWISVFVFSVCVGCEPTVVGTTSNQLPDPEIVFFEAMKESPQTNRGGKSMHDKNHFSPTPR